LVYKEIYIFDQHPQHCAISGSKLFIQLASIISKGKGLFDFIMSLLSATLAPPFLAIKTILHIKFGWWKEMGWVPTMHRVISTCREITNARLEAVTNWQHKAVVHRTTGSSFQKVPNLENHGSGLITLYHPSIQSISPWIIQKCKTYGMAFIWMQ
jgi:hypothetical protein